MQTRNQSRADHLKRFEARHDLEVTGGHNWSEIPASLRANSEPPQCPKGERQARSRRPRLLRPRPMCLPAPASQELGQSISGGSRSELLALVKCMLPVRHRQNLAGILASTEWPVGAPMKRPNSDDCGDPRAMAQSCGRRLSYRTPSLEDAPRVWRAARPQMTRAG